MDAHFILTGTENQVAKMIVNNIIIIQMQILCKYKLGFLYESKHLGSN